MAEVGIIMGSKSDLPVMQDAADVLKELGVEYEISVVSAHRTPDRMYEYAKNARNRGLKVIIYEPLLKENTFFNSIVISDLMAALVLAGFRSIKIN